jgi:hypothetical protein
MTHVVHPLGSRHVRITCITMKSGRPDIDTSAPTAVDAAVLTAIGSSGCERARRCCGVGAQDRHRTWIGSVPISR